METVFCNDGIFSSMYSDVCSDGVLFLYSRPSVCIL